jgi:tetratricopeptide (TPR) repeat protein
VLAQYLNSKRNLEFVIQHEICHLFGAVDLVEKHSIMTGCEPGYAFDDFTSRIILLNRNRPFYQASPLFVEEKQDEIISLFKGRAALNIGEEHVHSTLAILYYEKGDYASASEQCLRCLAINPESPAASTILGHILLAQGETDRAIAYYRKSLDLRAGNPISHYNLGNALLKKREIGAAIAEFQEVIRAKPDFLDAYNDLAYAYLKTGENDLSIQACRAALGLTANRPETLYVLALALIFKWKALPSPQTEGDAGILDEAVSSCQKSISLKPDFPEAHNLMGTAYDYSGKPDLAEAEFLTALELNPELTTARLNLAVLYFDRKQYEKSAFQLKKILETDPASGIGLEIMAAVFEKTKRQDRLR